MSIEVDAPPAVHPEIHTPSESAVRCAREIVYLCNATYAHKRVCISTINGYPIARLKAKRGDSQVLVAKHTSKADKATGAIVPYISLGIEEPDRSAMSFTVERRVLPYLGFEDDAFVQHILSAFRRRLY